MEKALLIVQAPGQDVAVEVLEEEQQALASNDQLFIAFYNMSGQLPDPEDFEPTKDLDDEQRQRLGLRPRSRRARMLTVTAGADPLEQCRLATAVLQRAHWDSGVLLAKAVMEKEGWVTHFAIGTHQGLLVAGEFNERFATLPGNGLEIGVRLHEMLWGSQAEVQQNALGTARFLPPAPEEGE